MPDTKEQHYYLVKPDAVVIVPYTSSYIVLLQTKRAFIEGMCYELPGGRIEEGEDASVAAARELKEECGLVSTKWIFAGTTFPLPSVATEKVHIFFARVSLKSVPRKASSHPGENINAVLTRSFRDARSMALTTQLRCTIDAYALLLFLERQNSIKKRKEHE